METQDSRLRRKFQTRDFGEALVIPARYADGAFAVQLVAADGEPLARLSINVAQRSLRLPPQCFYAKTYSENAEVARDAALSGWFKPRFDLSPTVVGWEICTVWELLEERGKGFSEDELNVEGL